MSEPIIVYSPNLDAELRAIADQFRPSGFEFRTVAAAELADALMDADYLCGFIGPIAPDVLVAAANKRLKLVQLMSAGYDRFNIEGARLARLPVADNGGANAIAVAEHAIMLMLAALKHLHALDAAVRQGSWRGRAGRVYELYGSTVGIVGMGRIGREVAQRLAGWQPDLVYYDPFRLSADLEHQLNVRYLELDQLLRTADAVTVHVPLNAATRNLIDAESLSLMKPSAILVNTARGGLVDEPALAEALRDGRILGAGLDVFSQEPIPPDSPLLDLPNVILTPHSAGPTWQSFPRRFANCFDNIERVQRGAPPRWVVEELADLFPAAARETAEETSTISHVEYAGQPMASDPSQTWASAEAAERWQRTAAQRQQAVGAVTEQMLNSVDLQPGQHVLDLAAGTGDTTLLAAARVGRDGSVLAVDISETMLHQATLAAQRQGLTNVQTLVSDIVKLDLAPATFDVAISRFGLMFLSDIGEGLRRIRAALKSGARLAALVWSSEDKNPYIHIPREVAEHLQHASNERSSPSREAVSLGAPGVFERALVAAGFVSVSVQPLSTPREFESIDAAVEFMQDNSVVLRELLAELESAQHAQARAELRRHLTDFVQSDGHVVVPGEALLGIGTAP